MKKRNTTNYQKNGLMNVIEWIYRTILLTFAIIIFSIMGLVVFGFGPALKAAQRISLEWFDLDERPFFKTFFKYYKQDFWNTSFTAILFLFMIIAPIINYFFFFDNLKDQFIFSMVTILGLVMILFGITGISFVYFFVNKYTLIYSQAIKYSLTIVWGKVWGVLLNVIILITLIGLTYIAPYIFGFFSLGLYSLASTYIAKKMFHNIYI